MKVWTKTHFILQAVSLDPEPAAGDSELRPLAAPIGQEPVPPRPIKTLHANGDL